MTNQMFPSKSGICPPCNKITNLKYSVRSKITSSSLTAYTAVHAIVKIAVIFLIFSAACSAVHMVVAQGGIGGLFSAACSAVHHCRLRHSI